MDDQLATTLIGLVERRPDISSEVKFRATGIKRNIETLAPLSGYKIGTYPVPPDAGVKSLAQNIADRLKQKGLKGDIEISFFHKVGMPEGNEIRYEGSMKSRRPNYCRPS